MTKVVTYGALNGHSIGIVMKELVARAMDKIREKRFVFEATQKASHTPGKEDVVTDADKAAQAIYVKSLRECFPGYGIIAEEEDLAIPCAIDGEDIWFTVDPLDGTKAYVRRQSHGIGTMLSLVRDGKVIAAYVGDVNTQEIYGYRPDSDKVHRITEFRHAVELRIDESRPLSVQQVLLRDDPEEYSHGAQIFMRKMGTPEGVVKGREIGSGSIGIHMARLWKGEVGMVILKPGRHTPWDLCPVLGISEKLGFTFLGIRPDGSLYYKPFGQKAPKESFELRDEVLIVHESCLQEIRKRKGAF